MSLHQQTARAMLDWSFELLSPGLQRLFCQLSVLTGSFTASEAQAVCTVENVQAGLIALVDQSLLEQHLVSDEPHFQMLGIVREYALERFKDLFQVENK
jgi:predicted ATPase